jgi:hypothetical protein
VLCELARLQPKELTLEDVTRNVRGHPEAIGPAVAGLVHRGDIAPRRHGRCPMGLRDEACNFPGPHVYFGQSRLARQLAGLSELKEHRLEYCES